MKTEFYLRFEEGLPTTTAQEKGECIRYKISDGQRVPYIHHFKKEKVSNMRQELELKLKRFRPKTPATGPVRLTVVLYFSIKDRKLWGKYKTRKPDCSNYVKEIEDAMTATGYWNDDSQISDLRVIKYYSEKATIFIRVEDLEA